MTVVEVVVVAAAVDVVTPTVVVGGHGEPGAVPLVFGGQVSVVAAGVAVAMIRAPTPRARPAAVAARVRLVVIEAEALHDPTAKVLKTIKDSLPAIRCNGACA